MSLPAAPIPAVATPGTRATGGPRFTDRAVTGRRKVVLTVCDQAVSSGSNFLVGVLVARYAGKAVFGGYMFAFLVWQLFVGLHRALNTEPMIISSDGSTRWEARVRSGLTAELVLGIGCSCAAAFLGTILILVGQRSYGVPLVALSPWLTFLLAQDFWRAMMFQRQRPDLALVNDIVFALAQVLSFFVIMGASGARSTTVAVSSWGLGAAAGACAGSLTFGVWPLRHGRVPALPALRAGYDHLRELWPSGKWLATDFVTQYVADRGYLFYVAWVFGSEDLGGLLAAFALVGPVMVVLQAGGNFGLPEATRRFATAGPTGLRGLARQLTAGALCCVGLYAALVSLFAAPLLERAYGASFRAFSTLVVLVAVQYVIGVVAFGAGIALKAAGHARRLGRSRLVVTGISAVAVVVLTKQFGLQGAGWAGIVTGAAYAYAVHHAYERAIPR